MEIEINIEDARWEAAGIAALADKACRATLEHLGLGLDWEVSLLACDDARIAELNATFRGREKATNVLAWPASEVPAGQPDPDEPELGDIAISYDTMQRESVEAGLSLEDHTLHLIVHALLHCLGYDHIEDTDAALMEGTEVEILALLGVANPY